MVSQRSSRPGLRSPLIALPSFRALQALGVQERRAIRSLLLDPQVDARGCAAEADPMLSAWHAPMANSPDTLRGAPTRRPMVVMPDLEPAFAQTVARAIALDDLDLSVVELPTRATEHIIVEFDIVAGDVSRRTVAMPTDIGILPVEDWGSDLDAITLLVAPCATIEVPDLVDLLIRAPSVRATTATRTVGRRNVATSNATPCNSRAPNWSARTPAALVAPSAVSTITSVGSSPKAERC